MEKEFKSGFDKYNLCFDAIINKIDGMKPLSNYSVSGFHTSGGVFEHYILDGMNVYINKTTSEIIVSNDNLVVNGQLQVDRKNRYMQRRYNNARHGNEITLELGGSNGALNTLGLISYGDDEIEPSASHPENGRDYAHLITKMFEPCW